MLFSLKKGVKFNLKYGNTQGFLVFSKREEKMVVITHGGNTPLNKSFNHDERHPTCTFYIHTFLKYS